MDPLVYVSKNNLPIIRVQALIMTCYFGEGLSIMFRHLFSAYQFWDLVDFVCRVFSILAFISYHVLT